MSTLKVMLWIQSYLRAMKKYERVVGRKWHDLICIIKNSSWTFVFGPGRVTSTRIDLPLKTTLKLGKNIVEELFFQVLNKKYTFVILIRKEIYKVDATIILLLSRLSS
jgi:hypothetical protein